MEMIKIDRKIKTGIIALVAMVLFIWGFNYLKGKDIFKKYNTYYAVLDNVEGVIKSTPVTLKGIPIGTVENLDFTKDMQKTLMVLNIDSKYVFGKNSKIKIYGGNIMGGKSVAIIPQQDKELAKDGDTLPVMKTPGMFDLVNEKLDPLQNKLLSSLSSLDSILYSVNQILDKQAQKDIKNGLSDLAATLKHFKKSSQKLDVFLVDNQENMKQTLENFNKTSQNLSEFTDSLKNVRPEELSIQLKQSISKLNLTLDKLNNGEGTMAKLMNDKKLYENLEKSTKELELLLKDLREHPKRYVHFSIFGKKDKNQ